MASIKDRIVDAIIAAGASGISSDELAQRLGLTVDQAKNAAKRLDRRALGIVSVGWTRSARWVLAEHSKALLQAMKAGQQESTRARNREKDAVRRARTKGRQPAACERVLAAVIAAGPQGLTLREVADAADTTESSAANALAVLHRVHFGVVRVCRSHKGYRARWVAIQHADELAAQMDCDREAAKARADADKARREEERHEAKLAIRRPRYVAGTVPPKHTTAPRSVFEWRPS